MKILTLNLKREYFEQIKSGIKTEEYRLCTPYWSKRLEGKTFDKILIKLGYPKNSEIEKILEFKYSGYEIKTIKHKHFGNDPVKVYAIKLESSIKTCVDCGRVLTKEEIEYYHNICDSCESEIHNQLMSELYNKFGYNE
ncbi:hypothetical protein [Cetobacterium sp.]|uniref:hypothetical protein n=1 Tax=Cetobacterium sp. TaxID=2071632 RepID=UPI003F32DE57